MPELIPGAPSVPDGMAPLLQIERSNLACLDLTGLPVGPPADHLAQLESENHGTIYI